MQSLHLLFAGGSVHPSDLKRSFFMSIGEHRVEMVLDPALISDLSEPRLLPGFAASWPALRLWRGPSYDRLRALAGAAEVEVMVARAAGTFVGDMEHLTLLRTTFAEFIDGIEPPPTLQPPPSVYLAQCPIAARDPATGALSPGPLHPLLADVEVPGALQPSQINFWANLHRPATSSLHYDPYCNLLCAVAGSKVVRLLPPAATPHLAPRSAYHDSANHAAVDLWAADAAAAASWRRLDPREVELGPGDALLIPEGWWHQVKSSAGALAVNFWWESAAEARFGGAADGYYFRRLAQALAERRRQARLDEACEAAAQSEGLAGAAALTEAREALAVEALGSGGATAAESLVAALLRLGAAPLMRVLLALAARHPGAAARLLAQATPLAAEVLTAGLERSAAAEGVADALPGFYDDLYACVEDRAGLTRSMLAAKEAFSREAMQAAVREELGLLEL